MPIQTQGESSMHEEKSGFVKDEVRKLENANAENAAALADTKGQEQPDRRVLVVTGMDERNTLVEEWLGLKPGRQKIFFSAGGRISLDTLLHIFGPEMQDPMLTAVIYLVAHQCFDNPQTGCAAFANDVETQKGYFINLRSEILENHPMVIVHVLALDTTTGELREIVPDMREEELVASQVIQSRTGTLGFEKKDEGHSGYGIYIGDAFRAWANDRNKYFSISADNPDIANNVDIALHVMRSDESTMDMETTPVIIIADFPIHEDEARTRAAWDNMERGLDEIKRLEGVQEGIDSGSTRMIICETDIRTWKGKIEKTDDLA